MSGTSAGRIPVILDTDIGGDIDDTWALAFLLRSPELDLRLVSAATGDTTYRARLAAKFLQAAGRSDVPVGVGINEGSDGPRERQAEWVKGYRLDNYPGRVLDDGVGAIIETIMTSPQPVTVIGIGPLPNIAAALRREPRIAQRARFVGMQGSIALGHFGKAGPIAEFNVERNIPACQTAFAAPWPITLTPLDTCGRVLLSGERYQRVVNSPDPLARLVIENYRVWSRAVKGEDRFARQSTILYDTVAVYLAFAEDWLVMREMPVRVTDDGFTREDPTGRPVRCAIAWRDQGAFEDLLVDRLCGGEGRRGP